VSLKSEPLSICGHIVRVRSEHSPRGVSIPAIPSIGKARQKCPDVGFGGVDVRQAQSGSILMSFTSR
jgi:hypothetical protein